MTLSHHTHQNVAPSFPNDRLRAKGIFPRRQERPWEAQCPPRPGRSREPSGASSLPRSVWLSGQSAAGPKALRFGSWPGERAWVAALVPRSGPLQEATDRCVSLTLTFLSPSLPPLSLKTNGNASSGEDSHTKHFTKTDTLAVRFALIQK